MTREDGHEEAQKGAKNGAFMVFVPFALFCGFSM
jgi:hypothetical protein